MATTEDRRKLDATERWRDERYSSAPERRDELLETMSGVPVEPLYTADTVDVDYARDLGFPGEAPFTRGVYPSMYRGRLWTMRQFAGFGTAEETNERFRYLLEHGQTGLSTAFDMPTLMGYDSDHPRSLGEVGREGVAIDSLQDMETLFSGIPLGEVSTSMTINSPAAILLGFYVCVGEQQGVPRGALRGTVQTDILKEYIAQKEFIFPPEPSMRLVVDMIEFCIAGATADASGLDFRLSHPRGGIDGGAGAGVHVGGRVRVRGRVRGAGYGRGRVRAAVVVLLQRAHRFLRGDREVPGGQADLGAGSCRDKYGARDPRSWLMRFHSQTAGVSLTAQQPEVNIVRTALEALAAVLGGTQSLHTNSFDEALALPTEHAVRIALRTQQVIAHESGVVNTIDPLGGSYFVEALTNELERQAYEYFDRIEQLGGVVPAIKDNFFQREIADSSFRYQSEIEREQRVIVGVNRYSLDDEPELEILRIDPALEKKQIDRVQALRAQRDSQAVEQRLAELKQAAARDDVNLMPPIIDAARDYVTMGEICDAFRDVWGIWRETPVF